MKALSSEQTEAFKFFLLEAIDVKHAEVNEKVKREFKKMRGDLNVAADEFRHQRKRD